MTTSLKDKTIDAAIIWTGMPTYGLLELGAQKDYYMINIPAEKIAQHKETQPFCVEVSNGQTKWKINYTDVQIGQENLPKNRKQICGLKADRRLLRLFA